jgi:NAD(P)-dependent dehydrogenase (short-subunit alcohol dehydrogenase family)
MDYRQNQLEGAGAVDRSLTGRTALVTGASRGIGRAIALDLAQHGARVCCVARNEQALLSVVREISDANGCGVHIVADLSQPTDFSAIIRTATEYLGGLDILVNNVGGVEDIKSHRDLSLEDWTKAFQLNLFSIVGLTYAATDALRASSAGRVINIGSLTSIEPGFFNPHYAAAKAALLSFSKTFANMTAKDGVLVNTLCVGPIESDSFHENIKRIAGSAESAEQVRRTEVNKVPLGRLGAPSEVAATVSFLASQAASFITGACITVDGGKRRAID